MTGAMSMVAGEYVSASSQADAEKADIARQTRELHEKPEGGARGTHPHPLERGLEEELARRGATNSPSATRSVPTRDELGIYEVVTANPIQAAVVFALTFAVGAVVPLIVALLAPATQFSIVVAVTTLVALAGLGASAGGAGIFKGAVRVTFGGALAMIATAIVGRIFGVTAWFPSGRQDSDAAQTQRRLRLKGPQRALPQFRT